MIERCREDFPTLQGDNPPAYLDNACVTLKPKSVIDAITDYYTQTPGCGGRSVHRYGTKVSKTVADARKKLGAFLNAEQTNEVVFTRTPPTQSTKSLTDSSGRKAMLSSLRTGNTTRTSYRGCNLNKSKASITGSFPATKTTLSTSRPLKPCAPMQGTVYAWSP